MSSEKEVEEKLTEMSRLAAFSRRLSDFHEENLKRYPFIFFDDVVTAGISYDLEAAHNYVMYELKMSADPLKMSMAEKRIKALENSIRTLLWSDMSLIVKINGTKFYESPQKEVKDGQQA